MGKKVKLLKPIKYDSQEWETGTIGEVVEKGNPLTFYGELVFDYYIKLGNHKPIGVFKSEVELLD